MPNIQVAMIPKRISPGTLKWRNIPMINKPIMERMNSGLLKSPIETKVASFFTTKPELIRAMIVINKPIPAVIPNLRFAGIWLTRASLKLKKERIRKIIPSVKTAVRATE